MLAFHRARDAHAIYSIQVLAHEPRYHESIDVIKSIIAQGQSWVVTYDDLLIGYALVQMTDDVKNPPIHSIAPTQQGHRAFLRDLAITPRFQRCGFGTQFVRHLKKKYDFDYVALEAASGFWEKVV